MKILNLYAGIGGNRRLWGGEHQVTAVEYDPQIAKIYKDNFPNDEIVVGDAHQYLLEHFREFDFIWASPPCPTHSRVRKQLAMKKRKDGTIVEQNKPVFPDMTLYQEIIFLDNYFDGYYCVENVIPYYDPLIEPQKIGRHCFWSNFEISQLKLDGGTHMGTIEDMEKAKGFDLSSYTGIDKRLLLRNCVIGEIGEHVMNCLNYKLEDDLGI